MDGQQTFRALWVEETAPGQFTRRVIERRVADLPAGDVLVRVRYSSLNYKDALSATGNKGVTRSYPHTPGIDAAGVVVDSQNHRFKPGDEVIAVTGELGVNTPGGYGQVIRVPGDWLIALPKGLTLRQSMVYGTAGFTAAMCVDRLQKSGLTPHTGEILVTGATGGVGAIAIGILAKEHFSVVAATGKPESAGLLRSLGAKEVIDRASVNEASGRPLLHSRWAGVVETLGGGFLSTAIRSTQPGGVVTACGNAASGDLTLTVYPFILRGVSLIGIDALLPEHEERIRLWDKLAAAWKLDALDTLAKDVTLDGLEAEILQSMSGGRTGRVVVDLD
jgi:alcohol dehydrogenase